MAAFVGLSGSRSVISLQGQFPVDDSTGWQQLKEGQLNISTTELRKACPRMLTRFYGEEWTEAYIHGFL